MSVCKKNILKEKEHEFMTVVTRQKKKSLPSLPAEVWNVIAQMNGIRLAAAIQSLNRECHKTVRFVLPPPSIHCFHLSVPRSPQHSFFCSMEWTPHGDWILQVKIVLWGIFFRRRFRPVFWSRNRTKSYYLQEEERRIFPLRMTVHPCREGKDVHVSFGGLSKWSHCLSALNGVTGKL